MKFRRYTDAVTTHDEVRFYLAAERQDIDRFNAIAIAYRFKAGYFKSGLRILERVGVSARLLRMIADELEDKRRPKGEPEPTGLNIVLAWVAAWECYLKEGDERVPTAREVKVEYAYALGLKPPANQSERRWIAELEMQKKIPSDQTFRKTLALCRCELRKESD